MKALMNSAVIGTIFFFMVAIATPLLLAQMGEAAEGEKGKEKQPNNKAQKLEYLRQQDMSFYGTFVLPMAKECANEEFGTAGGKPGQKVKPMAQKTHKPNWNETGCRLHFSDTNSCKCPS
jgi:hypothetical protein